MLPDSIKERWDSILKTDLDEYLRSELAGVNLSFKDEVQVLKSLISNYKASYTGLDELVITDSETEKLNRLAIKFNDILVQIKNFQHTDNSNATNQHKEISRTIKVFFEEFILLTRLFYVYGTRAQLNSYEDFQKELSLIEQQRSELSEMAASVHAELATAKSLYRDAAGKAGASEAMSRFSTESKEHKEFAFKWFISSAAFIVVLGFFLLYAYKNPPNFLIDPLPLIVYHSVLRFLSVSLLYFAIYQSVKNYKVHRHLAVVNKHRQNALEVFPLMSKSAEDVVARTEITTQAAHSIFEQIPSGYLDSNDDPRPVNPTTIVSKIVGKDS